MRGVREASAYRRWSRLTRTRDLPRFGLSIGDKDLLLLVWFIDRESLKPRLITRRDLGIRVTVFRGGVSICLSLSSSAIACPSHGSGGAVYIGHRDPQSGYNTLQLVFPYIESVLDYNSTFLLGPSCYHLWSAYLLDISWAVSP